MLQKQKVALPLIDMWLGCGIRCVILALIPLMAINMSFHRVLQAMFVLRYTRGMTGLLDLAFSKIKLNKNLSIFKVRGRIAKKLVKVWRCGLSQTIGVNPRINTPRRAMLCTHSRTGHMDELFDIWDRPKLRNNFDFQFQWHWQSNLFLPFCLLLCTLVLACVLWILVSKFIVRGLSPDYQLERSATPGNSSRSSFSCQHPRLNRTVDLSVQVNGNSVIYQRKLFLSLTHLLL